MPTAIIADDERLMREQLKLRLQQVWPELDIIGEAKNGESAIAMVEALRPDFTFLDIRMPGKSGLDAAAAISTQSHIVLITAFDQYAVEAFERGAIDYVLKPADTERLKLTVERLKSRLNTTAPDLRLLLAELTKSTAPVLRKTYLQWIQASIGQELRLIPVEDVLFFHADDKYTRVQTAHYEALIRKSVRDLSAELDPDLFWQIHRATLVNVRAINGVARDLRGRHQVLIKGLTEKLEVSRSYLHLFKQM